MAPRAAPDSDYSCRIAQAATLLPNSQKRGRDDPPSNCLSVTEYLVACDRFKRVGKCVAEVQSFAQTVFTLVKRSNPRLCGYATRDDALSAADRDAIFFLIRARKSEKVRVGNDPILDHFVQTRAVFAVGTSEMWRDRRLRRPADKTRRLDSSLLKDLRPFCHRWRCLPELPAWLEHESASPRKIARGHETRNVSDNAPANGDEGCMAICSCTNQRATHFLNSDQILRGFTVIEQDCI